MLKYTVPKIHAFVKRLHCINCTTLGKKTLKVFFRSVLHEVPDDQPKEEEDQNGVDTAQDAGQNVNLVLEAHTHNGWGRKIC